MSNERGRWPSWGWVPPTPPCSQTFLLWIFIKVWDSAVRQRDSNNPNRPVWPLVPALGVRVLVLTGQCVWELSAVYQGHSFSAPAPACSCSSANSSCPADTWWDVLPTPGPSDVATSGGCMGRQLPVKRSTPSCQVHLHQHPHCWVPHVPIPRGLGGLSSLWVACLCVCLLYTCKRLWWSLAFTY